MDQQRLERLDRCRELEQAWNDCKQRQKHKHRHKQKGSNKLDQTKRKELEDFPMGIRMVRYFQWRDLPKQQPGGCLDGCAREEHAVWACRATALRCGPELAILKACFDSHGPLEILGNATSTAYQAQQKEATENSATDSSSTSGPCRSLQQQLGLCVTRQVEQLYQRQQKQKQQSSPSATTPKE